MIKWLCIFLLLPSLLMGEVDTLDHVDSIYDCALSPNTVGCCKESGSCYKVNLGRSGFWYVGRQPVSPYYIFTTLAGLHLGSRDSLGLDSVFFVANCYSDVSVDSTLELYVNPLLKDIVTVTDTLQFRYGHYWEDHCGNEINDSSPTYQYQIYDSTDNVIITWGSAGAVKKDVDFNSSVFDSITLNGTGWHRIPIYNCVMEAFRNGDTYVDMIFRDKESYFTLAPFHINGGKKGGYMNFYSRNWAFGEDVIVIFYYSDEEVTTTGRRARMLKGN